MSEQKNIIVKIPHDNLKEKLDILEKAGIKLYSKKVLEGEKAICFDSIDKVVFSTHDEKVEGDSFTHSWREFVLEILKYYYCEVKTSDQADFLYNSTGQGNKFYGDEICFRYESIFNMFGFFSKIFTEIQQLTFDGFKLLLNSTIEEKNMKNHKKINVELTPQEIAFLLARTNPNDRTLKQELGLSFMNEWLTNKNHLCQTLRTALYGKGHLEENRLPNLYLLKPLFVDEVQPFEFDNGLKTRISINDTMVSVGCRAKTPQEWVEYCDQIIELGVDKVVIDSYSFTRFEIDGFRNWLKNNF